MPGRLRLLGQTVLARHAAPLRAGGLRMAQNVAAARTPERIVETSTRLARGRSIGRATAARPVVPEVPRPPGMSEFAARWIFGDGPPEGIPLHGEAALANISTGERPSFLAEQDAREAQIAAAQAAFRAQPVVRGQVQEASPSGFKLARKPVERPRCFDGGAGSARSHDLRADRRGDPPCLDGAPATAARRACARAESRGARRRIGVSESPAPPRGRAAAACRRVTVAYASEVREAPIPPAASLDSRPRPSARGQPPARPGAHGRARRGAGAAQGAARASFRSLEHRPPLRGPRIAAASCAQEPQAVARLRAGRAIPRPPPPRRGHRPAKGTAAAPAGRSTVCRGSVRRGDARRGRSSDRRSPGRRVRRSSFEPWPLRPQASTQHHVASPARLRRTSLRPRPRATRPALPVSPREGCSRRRRGAGCRRRLRPRRRARGRAHPGASGAAGPAEGCSPEQSGPLDGPTRAVGTEPASEDSAPPAGPARAAWIRRRTLPTWPAPGTPAPATARPDPIRAQWHCTRRLPGCRKYTTRRATARRLGRSHRRAGRHRVCASIGDLRATCRCGAQPSGGGRATGPGRTSASLGLPEPAQVRGREALRPPPGAGCGRPGPDQGGGPEPGTVSPAPRATPGAPRRRPLAARPLRRLRARLARALRRRSPAPSHPPRRRPRLRPLGNQRAARRDRPERCRPQGDRSSTSRRARSRRARRLSQSGVPRDRRLRTTER